MDIRRAVRKIPREYKIIPRDEEFSGTTRIIPKIEIKPEIDFSLRPTPEKREEVFWRAEKNYQFLRKEKSRKFFDKNSFGKLGSIFAFFENSFQSIFFAGKSVHDRVSVKVGWVAVIFFGVIAMSSYRASGSSALATLGEENPTAASGAGVSLSSVNPKISVSSHENRLADLEEKNNEMEKKLENVAEQTRFYPVSNGKDISQDQEISRQENLILELEEQIKALADQNEALIDFSLAIDYRSLIYKDKLGDLDIEDGKIKAEEAVFEKVVIKNEEGKTAAGEGKILPFIEDQNLDGLDDQNLSDGKSVIIKTEAVGENSRIFLTPRAAAAIKTPLTVTEKQAGQYFKVEIVEKISEEISFDWWIIETK